MARATVDFDPIALPKVLPVLMAMGVCIVGSEASEPGMVRLVIDGAGVPDARHARITFGMSWTTTGATLTATVDPA